MNDRLQIPFHIPFQETSFPSIEGKNTHGNPATIHLLGDSLHIDLRDHVLYSSTFCSTINGNRLYVGAGAALLVYQLGPDDIPVFLDHWYTLDIIWNVFVRGDTAFIANGRDGLKIIDCRVPGAFHEVGSLENVSTGYAYGSFVQGRRAYLANGVDGLLIVDISQPTDPQPLGDYVLGDGSDYLTMDVQVLGSVAYVALTTLNLFKPSRLGLIDISNPFEPDTIRTHQTGFFSLSTPRAIHVEPDSTVYIVNGILKDLIVYDCTDPFTIEEMGYFENDTLYGMDVAVAGDKIYLADGYRYLGVPNFFVFEKADIAPDMRPVGEYVTLDIAWGVSARGDIAYVSDEWAGLSVLDCSLPSQIEPLAILDIGGYPHDLGMTGERIYVASKGGNVRVVERNEHGELEETGIVDPRGLASGIVVRSDTLFIAEGWDWAQGEAGLEIFYAANLEDPTLIGRLDLGWEAQCHDLALRDSLIYIAHGMDGLRIVDAGDRGNPTTLKVVDTPGSAQEVFIHGNLAYVADKDGGLRLISIEDPENAYEFNSFDTPGKTYGVWVDQGIAYLADGGSGLRIVDCTDPASLEELGGALTPDVSHRVQITDSLAFVSFGESTMTAGISVFNVADPENPHEVGRFETAVKAYGLIVTGNTIYLADWVGGLYVLEYSSPTGVKDGGGEFPVEYHMALSQNHPNPFNPVTEILLELPSNGVAELAVFSLRGRKVVTLLDGEMEGGVHRIAWDGRDGEGRRVPAGIYFYRLTYAENGGGPSDSITRKLVILP
ncbi:MAG: T9SS type A sorting domain-containing protein [Candidatus Glassbacteria bacterium]